MRIRKQKSLIDRAQDYVESVAETVIPQFEAALESARDKAGPAIHDAREKAAPLLAEGRAIAAEKAAAGAAAAAERAAASREFAAAKVAELRAEPEPKGSKLKKALFLGGLLAIGGAVFSKLRQQSAGSNWQSSYVPTPPPAPASPASPAAPAAAAAPGEPVPTEDTVDDLAGSDPSEAISDAAEAPHEVTTPDAPAEIIDVDDVPENKH